MDSDARYRANLAAVSAFQPEVAAIVDAVAAPEGVTPAKGRDGSDTFVIATEDGGRVWFGRSSMPTISAPEMLANFRSDGGSVSLPGIFTGLEPLVLAEKLAAHCAVFVVEEDPLHVKLAMRLYDYTDLIRAGRLVFLLEKNLEEGLHAMFQAHPGYALPASLVRVPQRSAAETAELQRRFEHAGEAVTQVTARVIESSVAALAGRRFGPPPEAPRVAVLGTDTRPVSLEQARRVDLACGALGWAHEACAPDAPAKCHMVARLQAIERVRADVALMVNTCAGQLQSVLPSEFPVVSWYLPGADVAATMSEASRPKHVVFASTRTLKDQVVQAGVEAGLIESCAPGADDTTYRPIESSPEEIQAWSADVAVLMDLPDDRPEAANVVLESHLALWRALVERIARNPDGCRDDAAESLLAEAERESGTALHEGSVREQFVALLRGRIAPAGVARVAVEAMLEDGHRVGAWGAGWSAPYGVAGVARGPIPVADDLNRIFNATSIVVFPEPSPWAVQTALDALAAGAYVLCRVSAELFTWEYPGLAEIGPYLHFYDSRAELLELVRSIRSVADTPAGRAEAGRSLVLEGHTVAHRLRAIVERVRQRQARCVHPG